jgi:simple sugar transport system ATP-binding protein
MPTPVVEIQHVSKYFAKVVANKDVSITVSRGEVVALLGENGAGKSTIMKILYGLYTMDEGRIFIRGEECAIKSPASAMKKGIAMIQQHFSLVPTHTATENIILGNVRGHYSLKEYDAKIAKLAKAYGFDIPVDQKVGELAVGVQQKIEILKALYLNASILIMDEPTAVLTPQEAEVLMQFIRDFTKEGNSVIFITHKLRRSWSRRPHRRHAQRRRRGTVNRARNERARTGENDDRPGYRPDRAVRFRRLRNRRKGAGIPARRACAEGFGAVDRRRQLRRAPGEIFGIAGVSGNGQDALCDVVSGARQATSGEIVYCGKDISAYSIKERIEAGIGYVPVDRYRDGMVMDMTLARTCCSRAVSKRNGSATASSARRCSTPTPRAKSTSTA